MSSVNNANNNSLFYQIISDRTNIVVLSLSSLVLAAGAVTVGVALAGYLPRWCLYGGAALNGAAVISALTFLAVRQCKTKKEAEVQESAPLDADVLTQVLRQCDPLTLAHAGLVSKQWNSAAHQQELWDGFKEDHDWLEEEPQPRAFLSAHLVGKKKCPEPIYHPKVAATSYAISGNYLTYLESDNKTVCVWKLGSKTADEQFTFVRRIGFTATITALGYFGEHLYLGKANGEIAIYNLKTKVSTLWKDVHNGKIDQIIVTQNTISTRSGDQSRFWKRSVCTQIGRCFTNMGNLVVQCGEKFYSKTAEMDESLNYCQTSVWYDPDCPVTAMCSYEDKIICGDQKGRIKIWNPRTWKCEEIPAHRHEVVKMYLSGDVLVTQSTMGTMRLYDLKKKKLLDTILPHDHHTDYYYRQQCYWLQGVVEGMIITACDEGRPGFKIYDYRSQS